MAFKSVPVTILTGFLGSGKTSLLNHIIKENPNTKFAIIENEFGEINIDSELVIKTDENIFELSNGCICCSLNGDLFEVLNKLVTGKYDYDHLIIETTGIADPSAVASIFLTDYNVQTAFKLDGTVCLVDAQEVLNVLGVEIEANQQIAYADYILFNKCNGLTEYELNHITHVIKGINPLAKTSFSNYAAVDTSKILNINAYQKEQTSFKLLFNNESTSILKPATHKHHEIVSQSFIIKETFDLLKLRHYLTVALMIQGAFFYRIKGILNIEGLQKRLIIQSVKGAPVFTDGEEWQEDEIKESKIVFIGKNLGREILEKGLEQCLYSSKIGKK
jgi:G3E family GTPase